MTPPLLRVSGLSAGYGSLQVLREIELRVDPAECVAVLGSNGAGKSTLMRTLAGLIRPTSGEIVWEGRAITHLGPAQRVRFGLCLVPEGKHLFAGMTVRENLLMGAFARSDRGRVRQDLERVFELFPALRPHADQVAGTLSGGEQQMCSVGRGLMARPRLLLLDELSFGLAPVVADRLLEATVGIRQEGVSILLVEQDVAAALRHAGRGYVLGTGRIVREGLGAELLADPLIRRDYLGI
jgi:branched-chain amino acid transport system ATP-binding protein